MFKRLKNNLSDFIDRLNTKTILLYVTIFVVSAVFLGCLVRFLYENISGIVGTDGWHFRVQMFLEPLTYFIGFIIMLAFVAILLINGGFYRTGIVGRSMLSGEADKNKVESPLENSRFLTDEERDKYFPPFTYETLPEMKKDGVPARAVLDKKGQLVGNFKPGVHALVIGATGSGTSTTFINPMIQLIGATNCGSSMVITDPKGEMFDLHSIFLKSRGYNV
ncbi:MAG: type IV secretory system conjugative DNA transfer family protein, partial [Firmicutes bacterium]|nr:type IV secretory system conjugative DNA transfer family protein [Bacillota bacterium]